MAGFVVALAPDPAVRLVVAPNRVKPTMLLVALGGAWHPPRQPDHRMIAWLCHFIQCLKRFIQCIMGTNALLNSHFTVQWGGTRLGFMEVTGLEIAHEVVEFREGSSPDFAIRKMPG
jgi:hypothetical protein